ncbi:MAG: hypothetical protein ACKO6Q_09595 [Bacteroidota bacterium]
MKNSLLIALLAGTCCIATLGCTPKKPSPDTQVLSKLIQERIVENGNMPGGNAIDIHRFEIKKVEPGIEPNSTRVDFQIDFTRYPTSGLAPEYQTESPTRQTEDHQALLIQEKGQWSVRDLSLH